MRALQEALHRGGGRQAQFSHADLGGMGQWSAGGMTQVGDMFNTALKDKVNALCGELAQDAANQPAPSSSRGPAAVGRLVAGRAGAPLRHRGAEQHALCLLPARAAASRSSRVGL